MTSADSPDRHHRRRARYPGSHPRKFQHRYKEHQAEQYPEIREEVLARGGTPAGTHVPIMVDEVMAALLPAPGEAVADCTLGYGGHAAAFLSRITPGGKLFGFDVDGREIEKTRQRLAGLGGEVSVHRSNFAGIAKAMAAAGIDGYDVIFADLGVSSMQIDDPSRGFTYKYDGPLDMRMDERLPKTAADLLASMSAEQLAAAFDDYADEPDARRIAAEIVRVRPGSPLRRTRDLSQLVMHAKGISMRQWKQRPKEQQQQLHPAARVFQALRILVNDELGSLRQLLRIAPACLKPNGRIGLLTFHSGEERIVEQAFEQGRDAGVYAEVAAEAVRPSREERFNNPRSSSARLRWARRASA